MNSYLVSLKTEEGYVLLNTQVNAVSSEEAISKFLFLHKLKELFDKDANKVEDMELIVKEYIIDGKLIDV